MPLRKYGNKRDANEGEVIKALEAIGCTVEKVDWPVDLIVGYRARNFLLEVKDGSKSWRPTRKQKDFMAAWKGQVRIVTSPEEAIEVVTKAYA